MLWARLFWGDAMSNFFQWIVDAIKTVVTVVLLPFINLVKAGFSFVLDLLKNFWEYLKSMLEWMWDNITTLFQNLLIWISDLVFDNILKAITWALDKIIPVSETETFSNAIAKMREILAAFDFFLPLHEMFGYIGVIFAAWITCFVIRIVMSIVIRLLVAL